MNCSFPHISLLVLLVPITIAINIQIGNSGNSFSYNAHSNGNNCFCRLSIDKREQYDQRDNSYPTVSHSGMFCCMLIT